MLEEVKKYLKEFKSGTKRMFQEFFKPETNKKQRANMFTFVRLITPIATLICSILSLVTNTFPLLIVAGIFAGGGALTDFFDGRSARKHNSTSPYGKLLDQVADKAFALILGINLCFINPMYIFTLVGEGIISIINIYYKKKYKDIDISSSKIGKIKEWPLFLTLAFGFISGINPICKIISDALIFSTLGLQLATAKSYVSNNQKLVKEMKIKEVDKNLVELNISDSDEFENTNVNAKSINSKLEYYKKLRDDLSQVVVKEQDNLSIERSKTLIKK